MLTARDEVYQALFDLLSQTPGFASYWRRFPNIDQLKSAQKPALLMRQQRETLTSHFAAPPKYHIYVQLCIVVQTSVSRGATPAEDINPLIDAIEQALTPDFTGRLRLGMPDNVSRCWIEGDIQYFEAVNEDMSYVYVPVNIIAV